MKKHITNITMRLFVALLMVINSGNVYGYDEKKTYTDTKTGIIYQYTISGVLADTYGGLGYGYESTCQVVGFDNNFIGSSVVIPEKVTLRLISREYNNENDVYDDYEMTVDGMSVKATLASSKVTSFTFPGSIKGLSGSINCENLNSLTINEGVESVRNFTLNSNKLETFILPESVTTLSYFTLNCNKLETLKFPESILYYNNVDVTAGNIKELQFGTSGLVNIRQFDYVKVFSENCTSLIIPDGIELLDGKEKYSWESQYPNKNKALTLNVPSLVSVTIPKSLKYGIGETSATGVLYAGYFAKYCPKLETVRFKDDVTTIPTIFGCCTSLKNIIWPKNVERIDDYAFLGCIGLETLRIPTSVKSIGTGAFIGCTGLKDVYVYWPTPVEDDYKSIWYWLPTVTAFTTIPYFGEDITINGIKIPSDVPSDTYNNAVLHLDIDPNRPLWDTNGPSTYRYKRTSPWKYFRHIKHDGFVVWTFNITISASGNGKVVYDYWPIGEDGDMSTTVETCEVRNDTRTFLIKTDWVPMEDEFKIVLDNGASLESVIVDGTDMTSKVEIDPKTNTGLLILKSITNSTEIDVKFSGTEQQNDDVTLKANSYSRVYGDPNPTFEYTVTDGKITSGTPALSCEATATSPVGTYDIVIAKGTVSNSTVNLVKGTLTITKAPLTISAGNYTKEYGDENPTFKATYTGFKNNETEAVLTKKPTITTTATKTSPPGIYSVTASGAEAQNYSISYQIGSLTVTAGQVESGMAYAAWCYDGDNTTLYFFSSSEEVKGSEGHNGQPIAMMWSGDAVTNTVGTRPIWDLTDDVMSATTKVVIEKSFASVTPSSFSFWFYDFKNLKEVIGLENLNWSNLSDASYMFSGCSSLTSLDVSSFNTSKLTTMKAMFYDCSSLTSLNVSKFDTWKATDISSMFAGCSGLTSLDLSSFNTGNVEIMSGLFRGCCSLTSLDVGSFNTAMTVNMTAMFAECSSLKELDLNSFNTSKVTNMLGMFRNCTALNTIYVGEGWTTGSVTVSDNMFFGSTNLVGGKGTMYDTDHIDASYAHVDDGASNPGYLTLAKRNNDVDVKTIIAIIDHMMGKVPESFSKKAVDMNGDTFYNIADIIQIVNQILSTQ